MPVLNVFHRTVYRYANPVTFGEHRMMMRPRDSHDLRLLETSLMIQPAAEVRWLHDVFGNSLAAITPGTVYQINEAAAWVNVVVNSGDGTTALNVILAGKKPF